MILLLSVFPSGIKVFTATQLVDLVDKPLCKHPDQVIFVTPGQLVLVGSLKLVDVVFCYLVHILSHQVLRSVVAEC